MTEMLPFLLAQHIAVPAPDVVTNLTAAYVVVRALEALKRSRWFTWVDAFSPLANRIAAVLLAAVAAVGVNYTITSGPAPGDYIIEISGLTAQAMLASAWAWVKQFILQEILYRTTVKPA